MAALAAVVALSATARAQSSERYRIRLTTVPMDGGMRVTVAGSGTGTAVLTGTTLAITGTFSGLKSPATSVQLHRGLKRGVRGAAIGDLSASRATAGSITGSVTLTPDEIKGLRDGHLYLELASEKALDGNLWGWLLK